MARGTGSPLDPDALLRDFKIYDRAVDIVSAYHWLFTATRDMPRAVRHFERYPKVIHPDGKEATPDFTVLFNDGRAIVAEIANISLRHESVDSLCHQLGRYDSITGVPGPGGKTVPARVVDVMFLTPVETGVDAAKRVFADRLDNDGHPFSPARRPVLVQFAAGPDRYTFQFWPDPSVNGAFAPADDMDFNDFPQLNIKPDQFVENKARYGLMNDPVKPLYLATRLWAQVFPTMFWVALNKNEFTADASAIKAAVQSMYGRGRTNDVKSAMGLLVAAGMATVEGHTWRVPRRKIRDDVAVHIGDRIVASLGRVTPIRSRTGSRTPTQGQGSLFDV